MSSKSRNGLSKREYAAKKSGGTLNYKTGKISVPSKKSSSSSKKSGESAAAYAIRTGTDPSLESEMGNIASPAYEFEYQSSGKKGSSNKKSSDDNDKYNAANPKSSTAATKAYNDSFDAKKTTSASNRNLASLVYNTPKPVLGGALNLGNKVNDLASSVWQEAKSLGLSPGNPYQRWKTLKEDISTGFNTPGGVLGEGSVLGASSEQPYAVGPASTKEARETAGMSPDEAQRYYEQKQSERNFLSGGVSPEIARTVATGGVDTRYNTRADASSPWASNSSSRQQPQPVSPYQVPINGGLSNAFNPFKEVQGAETYQTPVTPENATIQRLAGRGFFSSGQFGNGAGDYGISGAIGGNAMDNEQSLLNQLLGIPTAQASTQKQYSPEEIYNTTSPIPGISDESQITYDNGIPAWKQDYSDTRYNNLVAQEENLKTQLGEIDPNELAMLSNYLQSGDTSGFGNVMGASTGLGNPGITGTSQPERGDLSQREYAAKFGQEYDAGSDYNRTYKKQEKNAEKANKELLKSIERQYAEAQTSGTADLEKAKQEDLLKLSGMFSFANSDPNDEQRVQYQTRTTNDYAGRVNELIAKLASAKSKDVSEAKQNLATVLQDIYDARIAQQQKIAEIQRQQQQQSYNNRLALLKLMGYGGSTGSSAKTYVDPETGDIYEYQG